MGQKKVSIISEVSLFNCMTTKQLTLGKEREEDERKQDFHYKLETEC